MTSITDFIQRHYRHFNAAALGDAAQGYVDFLSQDGKMLVAMAGAMSTAELGISLAAMIRAGAVHAISCTGANLEEDLFNLIAHNEYERLPHYRQLQPEDEEALRRRGMNRVTDTCIPERAVEALESMLLPLWQAADAAGERRLPHEYFYQLIRSGQPHEMAVIDPADSWLLAACERDLPLYVPGWEDSTMGNIFTARCIDGTIQHETTVRSGIGYMKSLCEWYQATAVSHDIGFFQIGGGIAGDFPICVVPMLEQDLGHEGVKRWRYFCQISDSVTSFGSYSGAVPSEKISWGKLDVDSPSYIIESDASIVAPLLFQFVLEATAAAG